MKLYAVPLSSVMLVLCILFIPVHAAFAGDSYVLGSILGTRNEIPGDFAFNEALAAKGIEFVEFYGFKLVRAKDGKKFTVRPNRNGYFLQELTPGSYTLIRERKDRPDRSSDKTIELLQLKVDQGFLVNLGTLEIILDGKPDEQLSGVRTYKGVYTYKYTYARVGGDEAYESPLEWLRETKPDLVAGFGGNVTQVDQAPTREPDGSKITLTGFVNVW
ncbi:hypothetical protein MUP29_11335 [bacterium]|nr:hypothetical protein [bacterium]